MEGFGKRTAGCQVMGAEGMGPAGAIGNPLKNAL